MSNIILDKSKFIHIPKCGGTAIQAALWRLGCVTDQSQRFTTPHFGHLFASQMAEDERINFAFVRNPVTWWHSFYHWNMRQALSRFNGQELKTTSFNQWIDEYGQFWLGLYTKITKRYMGEDPHFPTKNKVTLVGKCEHLYSDLKDILCSIGERYDAAVMEELIKSDYTIPVQYSNRQEYDRANISQQTREIIYATERPMFDEFKYNHLF